MRRHRLAPSTVETIYVSMLTLLLAVLVFLMVWSGPGVRVVERAPSGSPPLLFNPAPASGN